MSSCVTAKMGLSFQYSTDTTKVMHDAIIGGTDNGAPQFNTVYPPSAFAK